MFGIFALEMTLNLSEDRNVRHFTMTSHIHDSLSKNLNSSFEKIMQYLSNTLTQCDNLLHQTFIKNDYE